MKTIIVALLLLSATTARAVSVMDFDSAGDCFFMIEFLHCTYIENGIRMQNTAGHYDRLSPGAGGVGGYVNVDTATAFGPPTPISTVRFDLFGAPFNLLSIFAVPSNPQDSFVGGSGFLTSSAGGLFNFPTTPGIHTFSAPSWTNVTWVDLSSLDGSLGIDNFTVQPVPEPSALWLLILGAMALIGTRFF